MYLNCVTVFSIGIQHSVEWTVNWETLVTEDLIGALDDEVVTTLDEQALVDADVKIIQAVSHLNKK